MAASVLATAPASTAEAMSGAAQAASPLLFRLLQDTGAGDDVMRELMATTPDSVDRRQQQQQQQQQQRRNRGRESLAGFDDLLSGDNWLLDNVAMDNSAVSPLVVPRTPPSKTGSPYVEREVFHGPITQLEREAIARLAKWYSAKKENRPPPQMAVASKLRQPMQTRSEFSAKLALVDDAPKAPVSRIPLPVSSRAIAPAPMPALVAAPSIIPVTTAPPPTTTAAATASTSANASASATVSIPVKPVAASVTIAPKTPKATAPAPSKTPVAKFAPTTPTQRPPKTPTAVPKPAFTKTPVAAAPPKPAIPAKTPTAVVPKPKPAAPTKVSPVPIVRQRSPRIRTPPTKRPTTPKDAEASPSLDDLLASSSASEWPAAPVRQKLLTTPEKRALEAKRQRSGWSPVAKAPVPEYAKYTTLTTRTRTKFEIDDDTW